MPPRSACSRLGAAVRYLSGKRSSPTVKEIGIYETLPSNSRVFSMIQPTGRIHLGNYLGAVKSWRTLSSTNPESEFIFGIADLHALTVQRPAQQLRDFRYQAIASLLSSGLDADKCILYFQSAVPEHSELNWYLTCITSMGQLNRMAQWKSKAQQAQNSTILDDAVVEATKAGLFCYPALQVADILIYKSTHVPVGDDQAQHLELCRTIARLFNSTYAVDFFPIPETLLTPAKKILSLKNPEKKMSKSDPVQAGCVYVTDTPDEIRRKIRKATTDSVQGQWKFDPVQRPGVSNLINIISGLTDRAIGDVVADLDGLKDHKALKDHVAELIIDEFDEKRQLYDDLLQNKDYLDSVCRKGSDHAREIASANIQQVKHIIGLD
ncbi:uncharacterized protein LODBEIA_P55460 [Lodderomyces beijingensis]|uniref:tryptophan--tRNA ligase n=1 Tax=Lodderomyces beijingensis TaxID=1775926 RepID=A0ABP0ZT78_9ASCO